MSEPLPYSDVVKLESFLWEECMALLPHPLDCAAWIYVIGLKDMALDEKTCDELKMSDLVLGLEIDFWDEVRRVKLYAEDIHWFMEHKDECKDLFEGFARTYIQKVSDGFESHWLKKSAEVPDGKIARRPQWILDWQAAPDKKGWQLPPTDKKEVVLKSQEAAEKLTEAEVKSQPATVKDPRLTLKELDPEVAMKKAQEGLKKRRVESQPEKPGLKAQDSVTHPQKPQPKQPAPTGGTDGISSEQKKSSSNHSSVTLRRLKPKV